MTLTLLEIDFCNTYAISTRVGGRRHLGYAIAGAIFMSPDFMMGALFRFYKSSIPVQFMLPIEL